MKIVFSDNAWDDYLYWQKEDKKTLKRINTIIKEIKRMPYEGIAKPERLKHDLSGYWSRRINRIDRIVYSIVDDELRIAQLRNHY